MFSSFHPLSVNSYAPSVQKKLLLLYLCRFLIFYLLGCSLVVIFCLLRMLSLSFTFTAFSLMSSLKSERESYKAASHFTHLLNPGIISVFHASSTQLRVKDGLGGEHLDLYPSGLALCARLSISAHCGFISEFLYLLKFFPSCKETFLELSS